jgi:tripartite-type tricarboxylate transporter receptor subunit TctC
LPAKAGVAGYAAENWYGLFVPAKTSAPVIGLLNDGVEKSVHSPATDAGIRID